VVRSDKLDKLRWNQVGGPAILTTEHHKGEGCNILFGDGHVEFVKKEEIPKLR
jgi:prepilin-type processing-associated H-X9-DG protein